MSKMHVRSRAVRHGILQTNRKSKPTPRAMKFWPANPFFKARYVHQLASRSVGLAGIKANAAGKFCDFGHHFRKIGNLPGFFMRWSAPMGM